MMIPVRNTLALLLVLIWSLLLGGCNTKTSERLRIAVNPWVGFTPLAYAQQKGWLDEKQIKLLWVVGLEESIKLYRQGLADGFAGTQYEYRAAGGPDTLRPLFFFDRSFGADVFLSNMTLEQLRQSERIDVYLEVTGLNNDLLQAFASQYGLRNETFLRHASDPESMSALRPGNTPTLLIAYEPYATAIAAHGFNTVASTRTLTGAMVVDALWINAQQADANAQALRVLKGVVDRAVNDLRDNPREFYETVRGYLKDQSFEAFEQSLGGIQWLNRELPPEVSQFLKARGIAPDRLIP